MGNVNEDQHFLVWMRPAAARTVRKLYAVIHDDIPAGVSLLPAHYKHWSKTIVFLLFYCMNHLGVVRG